jgi:uncharacterized protein
MLYSALILGLLGSFHCAGMCGPIAWVSAGKGGSWYRHKLLYNGGRAITYTLLGAMMGLFGEIIAVGVWQKGLSIFMAVALVGYVVATTGKWQPTAPIFLQKAVGRLRRALGKYLQQQSPAASLATGLLNGLLPCGLVYGALLLAIGTGQIMDGMLFMAVFGLGTFPIMLTMGWAGDFISLRWKRSFSKAVPVVMLIMAGLFIFRTFHAHTHEHPSQEQANSEMTICKGD